MKTKAKIGKVKYPTLEKLLIDELESYNRSINSSRMISSKSCKSLEQIYVTNSIEIQRIQWKFFKR